MPGNGTNILIDGSATITDAGDSLRQILNDWAASPVALNQAAIRSRFTVNYNTKYANALRAGSGVYWFFYQLPTTSNKKSTDFLNRSFVSFCHPDPAPGPPVAPGLCTDGLPVIR